MLETEEEDMLALVAHDLKSPLSCIVGYANLLLKDADPAKRERGLRHILSAGRLAESVIGNLLDKTAVSQGKFTLARQEISLQELVRDSMNIFSLIAAERNIALTLKTPEGMAPVCADKARLFQVLSNLLANAFKFVRHDTGRVSVTIQDLGEEVVVTVADNGVGVPAGSQEQLFDKYYQAAGDLQGGMGLGLYIAKQIIVSHGGRIWVQSDGPETGTSFHFTLPRAVGSWT